MKSPAAETANGGSPEPGSRRSSMSDVQVAPAMPVPSFELFGPDPSTAEDHTVYEIFETTPEMSTEERNELYSVARFPPDDLHDLIPGTPPDRDFSNAKPSNQANFNTFQTYLEPYVRPITEEDLAFLREKVRIKHCNLYSYISLTLYRVIDILH
jgi:transcriptional adapter 3